MKLSYPKAPSGIREAAYRALNMETLRHPHVELDTPSPPLSSANGHVPDLHKVFLRHASAVAAGKGLTGVRQTGWYDVVVLSGVSHGIEVAPNKSGHPFVFVTRGTDVDRQLAILTTLTSVRRKGHFEVRVLRVPSIVGFSFWLKARGAGTDRIIPVTLSTSQLESGREYSPQAFFRAIRETATHFVQRRKTAGAIVKRAGA